MIPVKQIPPIEKGTVRIGKDLKIYEMGKGGWKRSKKKFPNVLAVVELFRVAKKFKELVDKKDSKFLKGQLSKDGKIQGARINVLPNGKRLDGAYSLFSPGLTFHDEDSHQHWDVIYLNPNGKFAYHYTLDKKKLATGKKYNHVREFAKKYSILQTKVRRDLENGDIVSLAMETLLRTHMRIGNEIYFKLHGHKGLTTLMKSDIKTSGSTVTFKFIGKDGVPQKINKDFPMVYVANLNKVLSERKNKDFVFVNSHGKPLNEKDFKKAFKKYIGGDFYPHIVRSYFATRTTEGFLKKHKRVSKEEAKVFLKGVADELGHKKFSKKTGKWEDSYAVTMGHYIDPQLTEKLRKILSAK